MARYQQRIVRTQLGPEQHFNANIVSIENMDEVTIVALGDLVPQPGAPLSQDTPVHSLILQLDGADLTVEFNDEGNQRSGEAVSPLKSGDADSLARGVDRCRLSGPRAGFAAIGGAC